MSFHIFHVIRSLGIGGGQVMMFELYNAFKHYHEDVTQSIHLLNPNSVHKGFVEAYNISYEIVPDSKFIRKVLKSGQPSVVLYHKLMATSTDFLRPLKGRVPVVVLNHTHTDSISYNRIRHADYVVAVCENMKSNLTRMRVPAPIEVIYNGVNSDLFDKIDPIDRKNNNSILLTGRINALNKIKYNSDWIEWCLNADLPKKMIHEYVGGGQFLKPAKKIVSKNKNAKNEVRMLGSIAKFDQKIAQLKSWDIFLYQINRHEGLSMAVLESLASGVPVICSNHHGNNEIIKDGVNGFVFRNMDELEHILTEICVQDDLISNMKKTTIEHFKDKLDAKITVNKYRKFLKKAINNHQRKKPTRTVDIKKPKKVKKSQRKRVSVPDINEPNKPKRQKIVVEENNYSQYHSDSVDENDKFSILTSSYNSAAWLEDWSNSILRQEYRPLEVVFVDDNSKDKTVNIINDLKSKFVDAGIEFQSLKNEKRLHCASSYQRAFQSATGFFMGVLDSDDMLVKDAVEYIMRLYKEYPKVGWIYTQYETCNRNMASKGKGFCRAPKHGESLLDLGRKGKHGYSHWRTFSKRTPKLGKIWKPGLECAVDKFMGYRLEEWAIGLFVDRVCYKYREGVKNSISAQGKSKTVWRQIINEAIARRKRYNLKPHPILIHKIDK